MEGRFSLVSWNVNSLRARWPLVIALLEQEKPDILLLQETKIEDAIFPEEALGDYGYNLLFYGQKSYNGVAILSKFPFEEHQRGFPGDGGEARYLEVVVRGRRIANLYAPNGQAVETPAYERKLSFYAALREHVRVRLASKDFFVIAGDSNVAPTDADVYNPQELAGQVPCTEPERAAFSALLEEGMTDAFRTLPPSLGPCFTWWDYRRRSFDPTKGRRIDQVLLSPQALEESAGSGNVLLAYRTLPRPSDHAPLRWEFGDF
ncbi:MAG: exodeoxyribonuclease III [Holosporales bacterium]|jgi:exodeoxyribonuclease-3|nr:exodeoxyribonuclease III [Holosporales bacterium]